MDTSKKESKEMPKNLWKEYVAADSYQYYVTIDSTKLEEVDEKVVHEDDVERRKTAYGTCGECNEPGTGHKWCRGCNAKRLKSNFKNWTSGNEYIDEFIQYSQLNAVHHKKCLEWIPFEKFHEVEHIAKGGFSEIYSAQWSEGFINHWDIVNQKWNRKENVKVALKRLDNSSKADSDFLGEIKSHLQIYFWDIIPCYGITRDPKTSDDYMMVLNFCNDGDLRNYLSNLRKKSKNKKKVELSYFGKIDKLSIIARGLLDIHNAGKVHKDLHSGNVLFIDSCPYISDLGMCKPVDNTDKEEIYGVLTYMAPEILRGFKYTKAADIYSFGVIMNEFLCEETPYNDIPHDENLAVEICRRLKPLRPTITEETPELVADLITRCWDGDADNRPTAKELYQILTKWFSECDSSDDEYDDSKIYIQIKEYERKMKLKNNSNQNKLVNTTTQYTSKLISLKKIQNLENSSNSSDAIASGSVGTINVVNEDSSSDCLVSDSDLKESDQE